jgi:hypothetical protein
MKNQIFLFALILSFSLTAQLSQPFGKNATWKMQYMEFGISGYRTIQYKKDTLINGEVWQMLEQSDFSPDLFFLTRNDSVFKLINNVPKLLYDFSAQVGDSWQFSDIDSTFGCVDTPMVTVTSVGYDTLFGVPIKYWLLQDQMDTINGVYRCSSGRCMGGKLYYNIMLKEHFGQSGLMSFNYFTDYPNACDGTSFQVNEYYFNCYQDNQINIHPQGKTCRNYQSLNENQFEENFKIFPNPNGSGLLNIESLNAFDAIVIRDISGKVHFSASYSSILKTELIIDLKPGLYFIQLKNNHKNLGVHKLVIQ